MNASPPRPPSSAYRYLFVLALGLLIGLIATVMVGRALQARRDPFPDSLMQVMQRQSQLLQQAQQQNRCSLADSVPRLQTLRLLSNDLDLAFPGLKDSAQFQQHASKTVPTPQPVTLSIGVNLFDQPPTSLAALIEQGDVALYQSKRNGRDSIRFVERPMAHLSQ